jgi:hypothetical protein
MALVIIEEDDPTIDLSTIGLDKLRFWCEEGTSVYWIHRGHDAKIPATTLRTRYEERVGTCVGVIRWHEVALPKKPPGV